MPRELRPFVLVASILVLAALGLEAANGRFWSSDLRVYWSAARALMDHSPVYGIAFGENTGFFKYAPICAMAFIPAAMLPFDVVAVIHFLLTGIALVVAVITTERLLMRHVFGHYVRAIGIRAYVLLACVVVLLTRELHLGNVNLWLVVGVVIATERLLSGAMNTAGILFGVLWLVKPYLGLIVIPLMWRGHWRIIGVAVITTVIGLLIPFIALGPVRAWQLHLDWASAMASHSGYLSSPDTFPSLITRWTSLPGPVPSWLFILMAVAFLIVMDRHRSADPEQRSLATVSGIWTALAIVPNLVVTDQEHFLFSLPLIALTLALLFHRREPWSVVMFVVAMVSYGTRSSDLWGSALEGHLVAAGVLGAGNALLILLAHVLLAGHRAGRQQD